MAVTCHGRSLADSNWILSNGGICGSYGDYPNGLHDLGLRLNIAANEN
jgi:hypothetical protein